MYLLNVETIELEIAIDNWNPPHYGILSHTWGPEEVTFADMDDASRASVKRKKGFAKIDFVCARAREAGLLFVWVDTCCIDKNSSAELSESINSMYRYYEEAYVCWVWLQDWSVGEGMRVSTFRKCRWFGRGWTLQELLAPRSVEFFDRDAVAMGTLRHLVEEVALVTGIEAAVLEHRRPLGEVSVAKRISWAAHRETTRIEDRAYSLLGIFGINMPMLYGEGKRAFTRLQEEILKSSTDLSIFVWDIKGTKESHMLLGPSPANFANCGNVVRLLPSSSRMGSYRMTNQGLEISLLVSQTNDDEIPVAILDCGLEGQPGKFVCLCLQFPQEDGQHPTECSVTTSHSSKRDKPTRLATINGKIPLANTVRRNLVILPDLVRLATQEDRRLLVRVRGGLQPGAKYGARAEWDSAASMFVFEDWVGDCEAGLAFAIAEGVKMVMVLRVSVTPATTDSGPPPLIPVLLGFVVSFGEQTADDLQTLYRSEHEHLSRVPRDSRSWSSFSTAGHHRRIYTSGPLESYRVKLDVFTRRCVIRGAEAFEIIFKVTQQNASSFALAEDYAGLPPRIAATGDVLSSGKRRPSCEDVGTGAPLDEQPLRIETVSAEEFNKQQLSISNFAPSATEVAATEALIRAWRLGESGDDVEAEELAAALREKIVIDPINT